VRRSDELSHRSAAKRSAKRSMPGMERPYDLIGRESCLIQAMKIGPIFAFNALKHKTIIAILPVEAGCHGQIRRDRRTERQFRTQR
jgi:hypothetical protein